MKPGEIWNCNDNCCSGEEREHFSHYAKILKIADEIVEYCLIDITNGELLLMVTDMVDDKGNSVTHMDMMTREDFVFYYNKLRDNY